MITSIGQSSLSAHISTKTLTTAIGHEQVAATKLSGTRQNAGFCVLLGLFSFRVVWIAIAMTHTLCIGCFGFQSLVYIKLAVSSLGQSLELYGVSMAPSNFRVVSAVYGAVAVLHSFLLLEMLTVSLWRRHLTFGISLKLQWRSQRSIRNRRDGSLKAFVYHICFLLVNERGFFGVKGRYFGVIYVAREIFETVLQSTQAYRMSQFVPRLAVNRFFVITIVINCWSTPIINYVFARNPPLERMLCLVFDIALDFISTVGVPLVLAIPYWNQYDFKATDFSGLLYWNDFWFVNMINQLRIVFVSSWMNLLSDVTFLASLLICLQDVKRLLCCNPENQAKPKRRNCFRNSIEPITNLRAQNTDLHSNDTESVQLTSSIYQINQADALRTLYANRDHEIGSGFVKMTHKFMMFWGLLLLILHFHATSSSNTTHCAQQTWPWLGSKAGCMFLRINCNISIENTGNIKEVDSIFAALNEQTLSYIAIRNCPFVEIPPSIQAFHNLVGVKIYNSTLARWDIDAALTTTHHPKIVFLFVVKTNMTQIPSGLLSPDFPPKMSDIEFAWTNLTHLPENLSEIWPTNGFIMFERSQIDSVPLTFLDNSMYQVAISGNEITQLAAEVFSKPLATSIWLNGNPISVLPEALVASKSIVYIDISNTMVQSFPSWVDAGFFLHATIVAGGTPLCDQIESIVQSNTNTSVTSDLAVSWAAHQKGQLSCISSGSYYYLYDNEAQQ